MNISRASCGQDNMFDMGARKYKMGVIDRPNHCSLRVNDKSNDLGSKLISHHEDYSPFVERPLH